MKVKGYTIAPRANLSGADLSGANLYGANLYRADLSGAGLSGAVGVASLGTPDSWCAYIWLRGGRVSFRVGCREFRYEEALKHWRRKPGRAEVRAAVQYGRRIALARGWKL